MTNSSFVWRLAARCPVCKINSQADAQSIIQSSVYCGNHSVIQNTHTQLWNPISPQIWLTLQTHLFRDYQFFRIQRVPLTIFVAQTCLEPVITQLNITVDFEGSSYTLRVLPYKEKWLRQGGIGGSWPGLGPQVHQEIVLGPRTNSKKLILRRLQFPYKEQKLVSLINCHFFSNLKIQYLFLDILRPKARELQWNHERLWTALVLTLFLAVSQDPA